MMTGTIAQLTRLLALTAALAGFAACSANNGTVVQAKALNGGIVGGADVTGTEFFVKSTVLLYEKMKTPDGKEGAAICTGTLISDKLLVTAAHCVDALPADMAVVFGTDISSPTIIVRHVIGHETTPVWSTRQKETLNTGDLALVSFSGGVPAGYAPAKMLGDISKISNGMAATLAGYGQSNDAPLKPDEDGSGVLRSVAVVLAQVDLSPSEILIDQRNGKGACHGDSGGPAYVTIDDAQVLIGVTSRGGPVDEAGAAHPCSGIAIYTNIPFYADWIVKTAKTLSANVPATTAAL